MSSEYPARGGTALAECVSGLYRQGQTDYWLEPVVLVDAKRQPIGRIQDGDTVIFCCRRGEREVQLTEAFVEPEFAGFPRRPLQGLAFVTLTLYHEKFRELPVAFAPARIEGTLAEAVSRAGLRQLHVAESDKFAHVTFFLNGGVRDPFPGEDDVCVPSPKGVAPEQAPELSLGEVTAQVLRGLAAHYDLVVANLANGDVIGHTASPEAKIRCAELLDERLGELVCAALSEDYVVVVTADHGNLEEMAHADGTPHLAHTANPVPLLLLDPWAAAPAPLRDGTLADVAPTVLEALAVPKPGPMQGTSLAPGHGWGGRRRVLLLILDGWGVGRADATNAIHLARTPVWDGLQRRYPCARLQAAGEAVGLQPGKPGNSEAGHMNIGAGRVVLQDDVRLDLAMQDGSFYRNEVLLQAIRRSRERGTGLHLIGLLTEKSSHGSIAYPLALLRMARAGGLDRVYLHLILDGRSTEPGSAPALLQALERQVQEIGAGQIVTAVGRGFALDRDRDYAKTRRAYEALVWGVGLPCMAR